jgi:ABC-type transport system involved in multi-copper enzyme maturation permease subunit
MNGLARLARFLAVCGLLVAWVFILSFAGLVLVLGIAVFSSGSTGTVASARVQALLPVGHFVAGMVVFGGAIAALNAVATPRGVWTLALMLTAVAGGFVAMLLPAVGQQLLDVANPLFRLVAHGLGVR